MESQSIKTFLFFDLETTGLPHLEKTPTKITELALIAVDRDEIVRVHNSGDSKENNVDQNVYLPRVISKMSLPVYPSKLILPKTSLMTGLNNENLEHKNPFDEKVYRVLVNFMELLNEPICLVAHNGYLFDYPLLQSELSKLNKTLRDEIFCVDSLPAFRAVLNDHFNPTSVTNDVLEGIQLLNGDEATNLNRACDLVPKCGWSCEDYDNELLLVTEVAESESKKHKSFNSKELESKIQVEMDRIRKMNENTPKKIGNRNANTVAGKSTHELGSKSKPNEKAKPKVKMSYNLKSVFEKVTGKPLLDAHRAEVDALALLECVTVIGRPILEWMDKNKIPFKSIRKIW